MTYEQEQMVKRTAILLKQIVEGRAPEEPDRNFKARMEACNDAKLADQEALAIHEMRVEQFERLGFKQITYSQAIELLKGEPYTDTEEQSTRTTFDYVFKHSEFVVLRDDECNWGAKPDLYTKKVREGKWFLPPFEKKVQWTVEQVKQLKLFKKAIPVDLLEALNHMRTKGFFNWYPGFQCQDTGAAVILGALAQLPAGANKAGEVNYYYIGSWGLDG